MTKIIRHRVAERVTDVHVTMVARLKCFMFLFLERPFTNIEFSCLILLFN